MHSSGRPTPAPTIHCQSLGSAPLAAPVGAGHYAPMRLFPLRWVLPATVLLGTATPVAAQRQYRLEVSGAGGYHLYDAKTELSGAFGAGLRVGYWLTGPLSLEVEGTFAKPITDTPLKQRVTVTTIGAWALANLGLNNNTTLFLKGGYGHSSYGTCPSVSVPGSGPCGAADMVQGGLGIRIALTPTILMRYEATINRSTTTLKFSNKVLQGGVSLMLGSRPLFDSDGDGVYDRSDRCELTRLGTLVDKTGCPTDRDGDLVPDGIDRCPNSLQGATVDEAGCTRDSDGDGYLDGLDQCPTTPAGAAVDSRGCPSDSDSDGVADGLDRCPVTPRGAIADALGCPGDADGDAVLDGLDECPETRRGIAVNPRGCPLVEPPPVDSAPPSAVNLSWTVPGAVWQLRGAVLAPEAFPILDSVVTVLKSDPRLVAEVAGFAHDRLVPSDNTRLSQRRAETVRNYIVERGVLVTQVTAIGRGSDPLIVPDTTEAARTINRRIEIRIRKAP